MVWSQLDVTETHITYAIIGFFSAIFSLFSLFIKERLFIGETSLATIYGLIVGPHCLNWLNPADWGNYLYNTIEIARIIICIDIVASSIELPKKYIWRHGVSVFTIMFSCMVSGWLLIGLFIWIIIPGLDYPAALLVSACITATDPVLAQAVVGKGSFSKKVPAHIRHLLICESACNDGMSVPFVYLALNLIVYNGQAGKIVKNWMCVSVLYMCVFGCIAGTIIGYLTRKLARFSDKYHLIDRTSILAFYITIALLCAGFGSILGFDDLLASFCAGQAFAWDGWAAEKTQNSDASTIIDLLLNVSFFIYFGSIIPWQEFNDNSLGLNCWRLILVALVVIFLRRIPASMVAQFFCPDIHNLKEAVLVGHFGPIGVSAMFGCIIGIGELESHASKTEHNLDSNYPDVEQYYQIIRIMWPLVTFMVLVSIIIHGSSVSVLAFAKYVKNTSFTNTALTNCSNSNFTGNWIRTFTGNNDIDSKNSLKISNYNLSDGVINEDYNESDFSLPIPSHSDKNIDHHNSSNKTHSIAMDSELQYKSLLTQIDLSPKADKDGILRIPTDAYGDGRSVLIEDQDGKVMKIVKFSTEGVELPSSNKNGNQNSDLKHYFSDSLYGFLINNSIIVKNKNNEIIDSFQCKERSNSEESLKNAVKYCSLKIEKKILDSKIKSLKLNLNLATKKINSKIEKDLDIFIRDWSD